MKTDNEFESFHAFWSEYLREHRSTASRVCHHAGILLSIGAAVALIAVGQFFFLPLAVLPAQLGAQLGHRLGLRSPKISGESPVLAAVADLRMFGMLVTGQLGRELASIGSKRSA